MDLPDLWALVIWYKQSHHYGYKLNIVRIMMIIGKKCVMLQHSLSLTVSFWNRKRHTYTIVIWNNKNILLTLPSWCIVYPKIANGLICERKGKCGTSGQVVREERTGNGYSVRVNERSGQVILATSFSSSRKLHIKLHHTLQTTLFIKPHLTHFAGNKTKKLGKTHCKR